VAVSDELSSALHLLSTAFYTDHLAVGTDTLREKSETAP
jgi:hypothetical protein